RLDGRAGRESGDAGAGEIHAHRGVLGGAGSTFLSAVVVGPEVVADPEVFADVDVRPGGRGLQEQLQVRGRPTEVVDADAKTRGRSSTWRRRDELLGERVGVIEIIRKQLVLECAIVVVRIRLAIAARQKAVE